MNEPMDVGTQDSLLSKASKYRNSASAYEDITYGAKHKEVYRSLRNEVLTGILKECLPHRALCILDVGCGTGLVLEYPSSLGYDHTLFGIDGCEAMLSQAEQRFQENGRRAKFSLGSCETLPFDDESLDVVIATRFIHLFSHAQKKSIYEEFRRVLRPEGVAIVEYYARPFGWVRYHFCGEKRKKTKDGFFSHYPTKAQVREIVGDSFQRRPIRLAGTRVFMRLLGERLLRGLTRHIPFPQANPIVDEYFVVTRK